MRFGGATWAALGSAVVLTLSGCSGDDGGKAAPKGEAAKSAAQAMADRRLGELATRTDTEPAVAAYIKETMAIAVQYNVPPSTEAKSKSIDQIVMDASAVRERLCVGDGQGGWEPGSLLTSMRDTAVSEIADMYQEENGLEEAVSAVVAGRVLTAVETKLCTGKQQGA